LCAHHSFRDLWSFMAQRDEGGMCRHSRALEIC